MEYPQIHAYCRYRVIKAYSCNLKRPLNKKIKVIHFGTMVPIWMTLTFVYRSYQGHVNHGVTFDV